MVAALMDSSSGEDAAAAYTALGAAQTALHTAGSLPENQIAAKQAEINALQAQVNELTARLDALENPPGPTEAEIAAAAAVTKAADTKVTAIGGEAAQGDEDNPDAGIGGSVATGGPTTYSMTIERPSSGTEVTITDADNTGDDDPKFTQYMDLGHGRTMHTREMEATDDGDVVEEVVIVSTDIAAPKAVAFEKFEDAMGTATQVLDANPKTENGMDHQSLEIDEVNLAMIATDGITATGAGTITLPAAMEDNTETAETDETVAAFETDATFNGSSGKLRCTGGTDCTVTLDAEGKIMAFGENWIFTPDPKVTTDQADYEYLSYGFWLMKTTDEDGVLTYNEVETFAGAEGNPPTGDSDLAGVVGSATYKGGSVGVYVKNVLDDQANGHL